MRCTWLLACLALPTFAVSARGDVLLTIDATTMSAATFSSTGAFPSLTASIDGGALLLMGAVVTSPSTGANLQGDLRPTLTGVIYNTVGILPAFPTELQLTQPQADLHGFNVTVPAFAGTSSVDLSFLTLAPAGTIGDIHLRTLNGSDTGLVIGQYQIVPEPATATLLALAGLMAFRRQNR